MANDAATAGRTEVFCPRNQVSKPPGEHLACPYCFARSAEAIRAPRQAFCDFDPEKDPVAFGFPEGTTRAQKG